MCYSFGYSVLTLFLFGGLLMICTEAKKLTEATEDNCEGATSAVVKNTLKNVTDIQNYYEFTRMTALYSDRRNMFLAKLDATFS